MGINWVTYTEGYPLRVDVFREELGDHHEIKEIELSGRADVEGLAAEVGVCDALYMRPGTVTRDVIEAAPELEVIAINGSGYDHVDLDAATEHGIVVTHNPGAPGPAVVEHTFGLIFSTLRKIPYDVQQTENGKWPSGRVDPELSQLTMGVVGLGTIGFEVAKKAIQAFDVDVIAYDPYVDGDRDSPFWPRFGRETVVEAGIELVDFDSVFERADLVSLHVPHTAETERMVDEEALGALEGGFLVNNSRGPVVDQNALVALAREDHFAGVALDVLETEPPAPDNPLLAMRDVYVTPHRGASSDMFLERSARLAAQKITTVRNGGEPDTTLNPDVFDSKRSRTGK